MAIKGRRVLLLLGAQFQDEEGEKPYRFLLDAGARVDVVGLEKKKLKGLHGKAEIQVGRTVEEVDPAEYDAMVIPGGRGPSHLRRRPEAVELVRAFFETGKPVAAICHGPQMLASAGVLNGRRITGYQKIKDEMLEAGAEFVDEPVVVDGNLITSRKPEDIPAFNSAIEEALLS